MDTAEPGSTRSISTGSLTIRLGRVVVLIASCLVAPAPLEAEGTVVRSSSMVTIRGCLERTEERFQLKDLAGEGAPTARNWKSGFLRRPTSSIDLVDAADRHHLPTYVGQRVSITGTLVDREMQVRSVAIVAESCEER